jgi:predicted transglutaminase-like cysteine proteinase
VFHLFQAFHFRRNEILCSGACGLVALSLTIGPQFQTASLPVRIEPELRLSEALYEPLANKLAGEENGKKSRNIVLSAVPPELMPLAPVERRQDKRAQEPFPLLFGTRSIAVSNSVVAQRWKNVLSESADLNILLNCTSPGDGFCAAPRVAAMRGEVERLRNATLELKVRAVNEFVNRTLRYASDMAVYGQADHWASLREFLTNGRGDCEDFAIAKMWMLAALGVPRDTMRMVVLRDSVARLDHAVLAVHHEEGAWVLDNRFSVVRADDEMRHYQPYYSLSAGGFSWVHSTAVASFRE